MKMDWNRIENLGDVQSPYASNFSVALDVCRASFDADYENADRSYDLIFSPIKNAEQIIWGSALADQFVIWREDVPPTMPVFLAMACRHFNISETHPLFNVALTACVLAEIPNENAYHNTHHFREVLVMLLRLCATWKQINETQTLELHETDILLLIVAAAIHDFSHDGQGNTIGKRHEPSRLEYKAVDESAPFLLAAGMGEYDLSLIRSLVMATDVSVNANGDSPARAVRNISAHHFANSDDFDQCTEGYCTLFTQFNNDEKLSLMALILCEADIAPSIGLSYDFARLTTRLIAMENKTLKPNADTLYGFIKSMCEGRYMSPATHYLLMENYTKITLEASRDSDKNISYS